MLQPEGSPLYTSCSLSHQCKLNLLARLLGMHSLLATGLCGHSGESASILARSWWPIYSAGLSDTMQIDQTEAQVRRAGTAGRLP